MEIELNRIYINGLLEPLQSQFDKKFTSYPYKMIPIYKESESYHVNIDGLEDINIYNNKFNMLAKADLFDNKISSGNITDLFSMLYHEVENNITIYSHYSKTKTLNFCPDKLGLLYLKERYKPLALQNISTKLYINIKTKQTNLLNILSH